LQDFVQPPVKKSPALWNSPMELTDTRKRSFILAISILFIAINTILIANEVYWFTLFPVAAFLVLLYFLSMEKIFLLITFLTPLSVNLGMQDAGLNVTLPTEPLLAGMLLLLLMKFLHSNPFDRNVWRHPVSIVIILQIVWMLMTSVTSEIPLVSFKYVISRLWFVVPVYFFGILVFREEKRIRWFLMLYLIPLAGVVVYTTIKHAATGFDGKAAHWVMDPFFNDHTAYGAILAMFLPISLAFTFDKNFSRSIRLVLMLLSAIIFVGVILSVSRAAWISVAVAAALYVIMRFHIRLKYLAVGFLTLLTLIFIFQGQIIGRLEKNTNESKENDLAAHAKSVSNITTDPSNLERLNRWKSGFRMFAERPFWGWGPGTYQFVYAPFQNSEDLTIISTDAGDKGNIHSEYIGPLCDSGVIGAVLMLTLVFIIMSIAIKTLQNKALPERNRRYLMAVFLGLTTYFVHGFLNNFLDTDKASVPFWGFTAIIVATQITVKSLETKELSEKDTE
jgi:putative inorganic carbon (hco3(-)) transporter